MNGARLDAHHTIFECRQGAHDAVLHPAVSVQGAAYRNMCLSLLAAGTSHFWMTSFINFAFVAASVTTTGCVQMQDGGPRGPGIQNCCTQVTPSILRLD